MRATGIGSMPGDEIEAVARWIVDTFSQELVFVPELPARGAHAAMIGRTLALLDLPIDMHVGRWRMGAAQGLEANRAAVTFRSDLDALEEAAGGEILELKQQFVGPFTLAAALETRSGQGVVADHGAVREVSEALADAIAEHITELKRRFGDEIIIQIDEPSAPAVFAGKIPTASGFSRYRRIEPEDVRALWGMIADTISSSGATSVLHCCARDVPVLAIQSAGFEGVSFDVSLAPINDEWAQAIDAGINVAVGSLNPHAVEDFLLKLGFSLETLADRLTVTPACGLAGVSGAEARSALEQAIATAHSLGR